MMVSQTKSSQLLHLPTHAIMMKIVALLLTIIAAISRSPKVVIAALVALILLYPLSILWTAAP